jgi:hypothetical protein
MRRKSFFISLLFNNVRDVVLTHHFVKRKVAILNDANGKLRQKLFDTGKQTFGEVKVANVSSEDDAKTFIHALVVSNCG